MIWWILVGVLSVICVGLAAFVIWLLLLFSHMMDGW